MSGSLTAAETLLLLAEDFAAAEPLQAVKCLEALLQAESPALPLVEVRARLRLASLLLEYTDNVAHAKSHLEHAVRRAHT
jgi:MAternally-affected-uncoordination protein